jgi:hypothetical protein
MPKLSSFSLPAFVQDFPKGSAKDTQLKELWNTNIEGWITQATPSAPSFFYDPTKTDIPDKTLSYPVQWTAFPGRLDQYYSKTRSSDPPSPYGLSDGQLYHLADFGTYRSGYYDDERVLSFGPIPSVICPKAVWPPDFVPGVESDGTKSFGPYGPRGWLDEYCEWSAARDENNNLIRVDFCCENPEYWNSVWKIDPNRVVELYNETLNFDVPISRTVNVTLADLSMPFNDPDTGRPAYNPLNKWNSGPVAVRTGSMNHYTGGAMHLTSTPNTLQTELGLAGAATPQYQPPAPGNRNQPQALICCGSYGQEYRNSDPHIGFSVNQMVGGDTLGYYTNVCLADPVGLYLQNLSSPDNFKFGSAIDPTKLPAGAAASDVFQVVRGGAKVTDPVTGSPFPGAMNLHVVCQIPSAWLRVYPNITLGDILIGSDPIQYAGQVARQFQVGLYVRPLQVSAKPPAVPCASTATVPGAPLQCMFADMWNGYYPVQETAPTGIKMSLASNTTFIAPKLAANGSTYSLVVTCNQPSDPRSVFFLKDDGKIDGNIHARVTSSLPVTYAVPGNSYPGTYTALLLTVVVTANAEVGYRAISVDDKAGGTNTLPAAIYVIGA